MAIDAHAVDAHAVKKNEDAHDEKNNATTTAADSPFIQASALGADGTTYPLGMLGANVSIRDVKHLLAALSDMREGAQQLYLVDDNRVQLDGE
jgi:hypothetical protein